MHCFKIIQPVGNNNETIKKLDNIYLNNMMYIYAKVCMFA